MRARRLTGITLALTVVALAACSDSGTSQVGETTSSGLVLQPPAPATTTTAPTTTTLAATTTAPATTEATTMTAADTTTTSTVPAPVRSDFPCPRPAPEGATQTCYRVEVPANWDSPDPAETVSLPVLVLAAQSDRLGAIVAPAGGPGFDGLGGGDYYASTAFHEHYDIVLYDQRGTGLAQPSLECPERDAVWRQNLQRVAGYEAERADLVAALRACRDRLTAGGVDLADYDTEASVRDLDAIREALGYDQWNVLGISYGARLAEAAMRSTPAGIRAVILDSVYDVAEGGFAAQAQHAERSIKALADACAADATCNTNHPHLLDTLEQVRVNINAQPIEVDVDLGQGPEHWVITGNDVMAGLFQALYDASLIPIIPALIDSLASGDASLVPEFIRRGIPFGTGQADGMQHSVDCADNAGLGIDAAEDAFVQDPGPWTLFGADATCADWPVPPASATFNEPVLSDLPTLVLAGAFDPVTPPDGSKRAADHLTNATFGLWPNQGHGVTGEPCAVSIEIAFLAAPNAPVDMTCLADVKPPAFA